MAVSVTYDTLSTITNKYFVKKLKDNFFYSDPLWFKLKNRRAAVDGGDSIHIPIQHGRSTAVRRWAGGANTFEATLQDHITKGVLNPAYYIGSLAIPQTTVVQNGGSGKILDLIQTQCQLLEDSMGYQMSLDLYLTGASSEDSVNAVEGIDGLTNILTRAANGTKGAYMGITRVGASGHFQSPTGNAFWNANVQAANSNSTVTHFGGTCVMDSSTVLTIAKMQAMFQVCVNGRRKPNIIVTSKPLFNKYHSLLTAFAQQMTDDEVGKAGFTSLQFNFVPIVESEFINSQTSMYFLNTEQFEYKPYSDLEFDAEPFRPVPNARVQVKSIAWGGNIACLRPNEQGLLTGLTAS